MYSVKTIREELENTLHQYLEADYHIWDESLIIARQSLLIANNITSSDPRLEASPTYKTGVPFAKMAIPKVASDFLTALSKIDRAGVYPEPRAHQKVALEKFLGEGREIIVATGTGSGKTESFLYPILGSFAVEGTRSRDSVKMPGCRVLLLYPMNALVNDQLTRLRKMFGNKDVSNLIEQERGRRATFGVYTSKTDYPGAKVKDRDKKLLNKIKSLYSGDALKKREELWEEGLWPAKNMQDFIESNLATSKEDAELYSRHEIQETPPDILVTNYSMLEYMLARPVERDIFEKTSEWLRSEPENYLTIVLDEAHMYRGVAGAEVALLLRRLQSRLGVDRSKIKFILTSASLGSEKSDEIAVLKFARELTGKPDGSPPFELVRSIIEGKANEALPTSAQSTALAAFNLAKLHAVSESLENAVEEVNTLFEKLGVGGFNILPTTLVEFKDAIYQKLEIFPPAALLANKLTGKPTSYEGLLKDLFQDKLMPSGLEALLALCTFAQSNEGQVFLPIRLHLMYRGIPGLYACINPNCSERHDTTKPSLLGKLYTHPALSCVCGGRVFEVLTHRDCGAAYLRGYVNSNSPEFLIDQQAIGSSLDKLTETHFLIESGRSRSAKYSHNWLHIFSGRISKSNPNSDEFIEVCVSDDKDVKIEGKSLWTFPKACPVCSRRWVEGKTKIQDLATKGEAPFSYLVRSQVIDQPASKKPSKRQPLGGRKTLVFSDGRQKAARLARDIPRNVEKDVFRICLVLAIDYLDKNYSAPTMKQDMIYLAFLIVISQKNVLLFDGDDRDLLIADLKRIEEYLLDDEEIGTILQDKWTPPPKFSEMLLVNLGSQYYSLSALTIASIYPSKRALKSLIEIVKPWGLTEDDALQISVNWLTKVIEGKFAFDKDISFGVRRSALGYEVGGSYFGVANGEYKTFFSDLDFLDPSNREGLSNALLNTFCEVSKDRFFVNPAKVRVRLNLDGLWHQCMSCTKLSIELIRGKCPHCGDINVSPLNPNDSKYLRARKGFYRDPVILALKDDSQIYNLCVEEHTAQLSHRDEEAHVSTNESYERRFKDILVEENDSPVDILSCTTTMEVGVDIGSLIAVSMRNVPPARQNYQQRAGRAGRRGSAVSTVLTFAQTGSHDSYFFEHPDEIISGNPRSPEIDITNEKVIKRHVVAAIIQSYFHRLRIDKTTKNNDLLSVLGLTKSFYDDAPGENFSLSSFEGWLSSDFETSGTRRGIADWIPGDFTKLSVEEIKDDLLLKLTESKPVDLNDENTYEEKFLNFLFSLDLLPSYAFPRHVCSFQIEKRVGTFDRIEVVESPQQNLSTALTEYAPGRLVVVNKKTYKVGTIAAKTTNTEKNRAAQLFSKKRQYLQCPSCLFTEIYKEGSPNRYSCTHCGADGMEVLDVIQPEVVYPSGRQSVDEFDDEDLYTSATAAQLPFMGGEPTSDIWNEFKHSSLVASQSNQLLVTINKGEESASGQSGFWVCSSCGKASAEKDRPQGLHERDYFVFQQPESTKCGGTFERVNTGYSFNSDVFILRVRLDAPMLQIGSSIDRDGLVTAARTLSEAILLESSIQLEIDPSEMNCGVRFLKIDGVSYLDIFIYDTSSGGAGYANMTGLYFGSIFSGVVKLLRKVDCCTSSCYRCLQNYGNRFHHNHLDKKYGLMLWKKINDDVLPDLYSSAEQMVLAGSLSKLMALEGWSISIDGMDKLSLEKDDRKISLVIYPALLDQSYVRSVMSNIDVCISDFEIEKSLASAYLKATST